MRHATYNFDARRFQPRVWFPDQMPAGISAWVFKTNRYNGQTPFHSLQLPSGITMRIISRGRGTLRMSDQGFPLERGDVFCAAPGVTLDFFDEADAPWTWYEFQLTGTGSMDVVHACGCSVQSPCCRPDDVEAAIAAFRDLHDYFGEAHRNPHQVVALLHRIVALLSPTIGDKRAQPSSRARLVEHAKAMLDALSGFRLNVSELAQELGVDRTTLQRAFKEQLGMSPVDFLKRQRIKRAEDLLRQTDMRVGDIAAAVGFANEKYFIRCFREIRGLPPGKWRRG